MKIYALFMNDRDKKSGVGYRVEGEKFLFLEKCKYIENWKKLVLELRDGGHCDYLASNMGIRICSEKLKGILNECASEKDVFQWFDVIVKDQHGEQIYYALHFPEPGDVLNFEKTMYEEDKKGVIRPVLSLEKCKEYNVFTYRGGGCRTLYVKESVMKAIKKAKCIGLTFEKAPAV